MKVFAVTYRDRRQPHTIITLQSGTYCCPERYWDQGTVNEGEGSVRFTSSSIRITLQLGTSFAQSDTGTNTNLTGRLSTLDLLII